MSLVLAAGCADGSVKNFGAATAELSLALSSDSGDNGHADGGSSGGPSKTASAAQPPVLLKPLGQAVAPDLRAVVCLAAACHTSKQGGRTYKSY